MSKKRKTGELSETMESLKSRNEELEAQNMTLMARIQEFEQEIRQLKEYCKCPKDIAGDFRIVPLRAMRKIFEFLSFDDLKELRCVSSWFFTTVSNEFDSLFGTYHIKLEQVLVSRTSSGMKCNLKVPKEIDAVIRPEVKLAFNLKIDTRTGEPDADFVQEILKYKNNITEINVALCHDKEFIYLLEEDFYFKNLERMNIDMKYCKYKYCSDDHLDFVKDTCSDFISRYANQLLHLSFSGMGDWMDLKEPHKKVAYLPNLKSLSHKIYWDRDASFLMKSVNFANVTKLEIDGFVPRNIDITDLNIRNLSVLSLDVIVDEQWFVRLLKSNSSTLTKLKIGFNLDDLDDSVFNDIQFSKLKYLNINGMNETDALTLIQSSKNTIAEIHLSELHTYLGYNNLESVTFLQLPHLKKVHLDIGFKHILSSKLVHSIINACDENTIVLIKDKKINKSLLEELRN